MPVHDDLGKRMKEYYENIPKIKLMRRVPVAIRLDGKAFHTFTKGFQKPFDEVLIRSMQETMKYLCENIQGCVIGYTQSDGITLIIVDYKELNTDAWFGYEVEKMCSISASMATMAFNSFFVEEVTAWQKRTFSRDYLGYNTGKISETDIVLLETYGKAIAKGAMFDARCFNIPKEEVTNLIYWRQLDATRNSIQMVGQANFSHKELQNKSCNDIQDMLMLQKGINWNNLPTYQKRGSCCVKMYQISEGCFQSHAEDKLMQNGRTRWEIDTEIPIFKGEGREYIERLINF